MAWRFITDSQGRIKGVLNIEGSDSYFGFPITFVKLEDRIVPAIREPNFQYRYNHRVLDLLGSQFGISLEKGFDFPEDYEYAFMIESSRLKFLDLSESLGRQLRLISNIPFDSSNFDKAVATVFARGMYGAMEFDKMLSNSAYASLMSEMDKFLDTYYLSKDSVYTSSSNQNPNQKM